MLNINAYCFRQYKASNMWFSYASSFGTTLTQEIMLTNIKIRIFNSNNRLAENIGANSSVFIKISHPATLPQLPAPPPEEDPILRDIDSKLSKVLSHSLVEVGSEKREVSKETPREVSSGYKPRMRRTKKEMEERRVKTSPEKRIERKKAKAETKESQPDKPGRLNIASIPPLEMERPEPISTKKGRGRPVKRPKAPRAGRRRRYKESGAGFARVGETRGRPAGGFKTATVVGGKAKFTPQEQALAQFETPRAEARQQIVVVPRTDIQYKPKTPQLRRPEEDIWRRR